MIISSLFFALNSSAAAFDSLIDLIRFFRNSIPPTLLLSSPNLRDHPTRITPFTPDSTRDFLLFSQSQNKNASERR